MNDDVFDRLKTMTGGLGPDACIDAVGMEAHGAHIDYWGMTRRRPPCVWLRTAPPPFGRRSTAA